MFQPVFYVFCALTFTIQAFADTGYAAKRTAWDVPDFSGVWDFRSLTPLERPPELSGKETLSEAEATGVTREVLSRFEDVRVKENPALDVEGAYNAFWLDPGQSLDEEMRTSLIVDPPNGRLPEMVPGAKAHMLAQNRMRTPPVRDYFSYSVGPNYRHSDPESLGLSERCLIGFNAGPPIMPSAYNNNLRIIQTPGYVVIVTEMIHQARIVPVSEGGHLAAGVKQWLGSSVGRWEGDALVVETSNFTDKTPAFQLPVVVTDPDASGAIGSGANLHLIERFKLTGEGRLAYEFTLDAPDSFKRPFTVRFTMRSSADRLYEYACHEGNYAMGNILRGARLAEREGTP